MSYQQTQILFSDSSCFIFSCCDHQKFLLYSVFQYLDLVKYTFPDEVVGDVGNLPVQQVSSENWFSGGN